MKTAIIGLGGMGSTHYNMFRDMDDIEIIALVDVEEDRITEKAAQCGARGYTDINDMLGNEKPDFVMICTPSYLHYEHAVAAMEKGIHVFTEKPAALDENEITEMFKCASKNNVCFMTGHVLRFWIEYNWLKETVESGKYGRLYHLNMWRMGQQPTYTWQNWMLDEEKSGLVPFDLQIHDIDFAVYLLGAPEKSDYYQINSEPGQFVEIKLEYNNGTRVNAKASWLIPKIPFEMGFEAIFEHGYAEFRNDKLTFFSNDGEEFNPVNEAAQDGSEISVTNTLAYVKEQRYFINCIREGKKPSFIKEEEMLTTLKILKGYKKAR